jgi:serine/threonine protein kinase
MANEALTIGAIIAGKYRVRRIIGRGSMGVVCEAEHIEIGKRVAIKLIDASLAGMRDVAERFRREARAASLVESHHIVQVFDVGSDDDLGLYLVMEYLAGEDLARLLAREKRLAPDVAVHVAVQVARGLAKAHEAGVVHRDLKPANIFLCMTEDDRPLAKILDFGISKVVDSSRASSTGGLKLTRDGMAVGTPQYMSPEQAQGQLVDHRTDVWALGLVLYEMLAGRPAYPELPSYEQFIIHLVSVPPEPLRQTAPWISEELAAIVHGALEHDLTRRTQNCGEIVRRLLLLSDPAGARGLRQPTRTQASPSFDAGAPEATDTWRDLTGRAAGPPSSSGSVAVRSHRIDSSIGSSGIRDSSREMPAHLEDLEGEGPQFFDRKSLQGLRPLADGAAADPHLATGGPSSDPEAASRAEPAHGTRLVWAALALLAVALAAAAFALR